MKFVVLIAIFFIVGTQTFAQVDTIVIGFGSYDGVTVTASDDTQTDPENTLNQDGYLPNLTAAARFL